MTSPKLNSLQFDIVKRTLEHNCGIRIVDGLQAVLEIRLQRFAAKRDIQLETLVYRLNQEEKLLSELALELAIHETYFNREKHHFTFLCKHALPELLQEKSHTVSILSAGCASGEEVYSIRMNILEMVPHFHNRVFVDGIDFSQAMIEAAITGTYEPHALRELSVPTIGKFFDQQADGKYKIHSQLAENTRFLVKDLLKEALTSESYDMIFCRNLLMYLTKDARNRLVSSFSLALKPGGFLIIGTTETAPPLPKGIARTRFHSTFYFTKQRVKP